MPNGEENKVSGTKLREQIKNAMEKLVTLQIVTVVGGVKCDSKGEYKIDINNNTKTILTKIDLLQGDITTSIDPQFLTSDYQFLRDFHAAREKEGYGIIEKNVAAIKSFVGLIKDVFDESGNE